MLVDSAAICLPSRLLSNNSPRRLAISESMQIQQCRTGQGSMAISKVHVQLQAAIGQRQHAARNRRAGKQGKWARCNGQQATRNYSGNARHAQQTIIMRHRRQATCDTTARQVGRTISKQTNKPQTEGCWLARRNPSAAHVAARPRERVAALGCASPRPCSPEGRGIGADHIYTRTGAPRHVGNRTGARPSHICTGNGRQNVRRRWRCG